MSVSFRIGRPARHVPLAEAHSVPARPAPLLRVSGLSRRFGGLKAVDNVSFAIAAGSVVGLIGPNGSGKSTLFDLITNVRRRHSGTIHYKGRRVDGRPLNAIARLGIGRTYQSIRIFQGLPVWMNLEIAAMGRRCTGWEDAGRHWLSRFRLDHLATERAENLSIGQQRLLEVAMNLVVAPELLLLDEPLAGVNPVIRDLIADTILERRAAGQTFLIIEHHMSFIMRLCERILVMDHGVIIAEGPPEAVRANSRVLEALLGSGGQAVRPEQG